MKIKQQTKLIISAAVLTSGLAFVALSTVFAAEETSSSSSSSSQKSTQVAEPSGAQSSQAQSGQQAQAGQGEVSIPLYQETVNISKRTVDGQVVLRKVISTETVSKPVELRRETIVIEHVQDGASAGTASASSSGNAFQEKSFSIPVQREEVVIQKGTQLKGNVVARRSAGTQQSMVQEQIRKEDVQVEDSAAGQGVVLRGKFYEINEAAGAQPQQKSQSQGQQQQQPQQQQQEQK